MAGIDQNTLWQLASMILGKSKAQPTTRERATFLRTDPDGTQWVRLPSSNDETPVNGRTLATAKAGDTVEWSIHDGRLSITGNESQPSVGMREVFQTASDIVQPVVARITKVNELATLSKNVADAAQQVADAVNQHFFSDTNGVHVTEATQEDWDESHEGANVLLNAAGQLFRDGLVNLLTLTTESGARALTVWDGLGNAAENIRAIIGETIQLGSTASGNYVTIDSSGMGVTKSGDSVASFGSTARIGKANSDRVTVDSTNGITVYKGNSKRLQTTANGIDVYGSDGATSVASFGATARVGTANALHVNVGTVIGDDRAVSISDIDGNSFVDVVVHNVGLGNGTESPSMEINVPDSSDSVLWLHKMMSDDGESFLNKYEAELCLGRFVVYKTDHSTGQQTAIVETTDTELNTEVNFVCEGDITGRGDITCSGDAMFSGKTWTVGLESSSQIIGAYQLVAEGTQNSIALRANTVGYRGLYDVTNDEWILYRDGNNDNLVIKFLASNFDTTSVAILSGSTTIAAGGIQSGTTNISKSGWYPIAIAGWTANTRYAVPVRYYLSARGNGTGTISWAFYNASSNNQAPTANVVVLWARGG